MSHAQKTNGTLSLYLLSIRGTLAPETLEAARTLHNQTAGNPASIAAAQSLGDLSHMVYVPLGTQDAGEILFLDLWYSLDGLNQFFANPQVQEQAGQIFRTRDPLVWVPAEGFLSYHLPTPHHITERFVATVRGIVHSREDAQSLHNAIVADNIGKARQAGHVSHQAYFQMAPADGPASLEFFAVDVWMNAGAMAEYYGNPELLQAFGSLFVAPPSNSAWAHPEGEWVEW